MRAAPVRWWRTRPAAVRTALACLVLPVAAGVAPTPVRAAPETYRLDPTHTTPMFEVLHLGLSLQRGFFTNASGTITLDRAAGSGSVDVVIGAGSVTTGSRVLNDVLKGPDFFDAERHPVVTYRARAVEFDGGKPVRAMGELTLLGVTKPVPLAIGGFRCTSHPLYRRPICGAEATAQIRRSDFGMTYGLPAAVADDVRIVIPIEALRD
jgi:polyisoprenoid-binding protein YceI